MSSSSSSPAAATKHQLENVGGEQQQHSKLFKSSSNGAGGTTTSHSTSQNNQDTNNNDLLNRNIFYQKSNVSQESRMRSYSNSNQNGCTIWLTGLSCSGKTTIGFALEEYLIKHRHVSTYCLDGDNIRHGLNSNLGFTPSDRTENIRRIGEVAKLFADSGTICITSFISPFVADRQRVREMHQRANLKFVECYVNTPIEVCERRDVKGLYKKARAGLIKDFTGIDSPYEMPTNPEIVIDTTQHSIQQCVLKIINYLSDKQILGSGNNNRHSMPESMPAAPMEQLNEVNEIEYKSRELFPSSGDELQYIIESCEKAALHLEISKIELQWVQVLSEGWAHPLRGFMNEEQYLQALHFNSIKVDGVIYNQSVPIVLSCKEEEMKALEKLSNSNKSICLTYAGKRVALLTNVSVFPHRKEERCARQFGIVHRSHPYQKFIFEECGDWLIGGDLRVIERIRWNDGLDQYRMTPFELRQRFKQINADAVFAFQLRNPIHNGHALLMRDTRQYLLGKGYRNPVLLLHPLGGWTKDDDAPLDVRIEQHKAVLDDGNFLDADATIMAIFPSPMMYAGPTEVQWHAKTRMNAGVQYYIVGRDPAGMPHPDTKKDLYDPSHGARVLQMAPGLADLKIVPFKPAAYNKELKKMDYLDATHAEKFENISGTKMRKLARDGELPPDGFMIAKAWTILANYYKSLNSNSNSSI